MPFVDLPPPVMVVAALEQSVPPPPGIYPPPMPAPPPAPPGPPKPPAVTPSGNPGMWFSPKDYPKAARDAKQAGRVAVRLTINRKGRVIGCDVTSSSGFALLDAQTCELAKKRGSFVVRPGQPKAQKTFTYPMLVRWSLADE